MKTWKLAAVCAGLTLAAIAAEMSGDYNSWLGYLAGMNTWGDRSTVQGAGAGGEADNIVRTDFIGAAAGAFTTNMTDCVGIGYRALRNAQDMNSVVAIGAGALSNRTGLTKATWINGQFYTSAQGNTFWIKSNPDTPTTNAPIYYADGTLYLNAATIKFNGEATAGGGGGGGGDSSPVLLGYDFYVDPMNGDDIYAGTSPGTAKRTIDAAYALVYTNDLRICLLPGTHASPGGDFSTRNVYPAYRVHFIAPYGPDKTRIDGGDERYFTGCSRVFTSVSGCSLSGFRVVNNSTPAFFALYFTNCVFSGDAWQPSKEKAPVFEYCIFEDCRADLARTIQTDGESSNSMSSFFMGCEAWDSVFHIANTNAPKNFAYCSVFHNCYVWTENASRLAIAGSSVLENAAAFIDSTVICPTAGEIFGSVPANGCLLGVGTNGTAFAWNDVTNSVLTNATALAAILGADYRPAVTNWRYRYLGYGSAAERATRDSMLESIRAALEAASTE